MRGFFCPKCGYEMAHRVGSDDSVHVCNEMVACPTDVQQALMTLQEADLLDADPFAFDETKQHLVVRDNHA